jgi:hypothetical protein
MRQSSGKRIPIAWAGSLGLAAMLLAPQAAAQQRPAFDYDEFRRRQAIMTDVLERAREIMPRRRDEPLRDINISDDEIREIQFLVRNVLPRAIVNIGPVVTGCPCEEGVGCTEQVHIQANTATKSMGLLLSRSLDSWRISEVQAWWLRWHALEEARDQLDWEEQNERVWKLIQDFPVCTRAPSTAENAQVPSRAEPSQ